MAEREEKMREYAWELEQHWAEDFARSQGVPVIPEESQLKKLMLGYNEVIMRQRGREKNKARYDLKLLRSTSQRDYRRHGKSKKRRREYCKVHGRGPGDD
jgi:hypothetical protein